MFLSGLHSQLRLINLNFFFENSKIGEVTQTLGDLSNLFGGVTSVCLLSWPELCRLTESHFNHSGREEVVSVASCSMGVKFFTVESAFLWYHWLFGTSAVLVNRV